MSGCTSVSTGKLVMLLMGKQAVEKSISSAFCVVVAPPDRVPGKFCGVRMNVSAAPSTRCARRSYVARIARPRIKFVRSEERRVGEESGGGTAASASDDKGRRKYSNHDG